MMSLWGDDFPDNDNKCYRLIIGQHHTNEFWKGVDKVLPFIFYIAGSVCFLVGSIISIVRSL